MQATIFSPPRKNKSQHFQHTFVNIKITISITRPYVIETVPLERWQTIVWSKQACSWWKLLFVITIVNLPAPASTAKAVHSLRG